MCFSVEWLVALLVWVVIICAVVAILRLLVAFVLPRLGLAGEVLNFLFNVVRIVIWAIIIIAIIYFVGDLIICLIHGGLSLPRLH